MYWVPGEVQYGARVCALFLSLRAEDAEEGEAVIYSRALPVSAVRGSEGIPVSIHARYLLLNALSQFVDDIATAFFKSNVCIIQPSDLLREVSIEK